jgi:DNA-binding NtrC family response regulator
VAAIQDRVLAVDDSWGTLRMQEHDLTSEGYALLTATSVAQAIELPPLRDRAEDPLLLAQQFLHQFSAHSSLPTLRFSDRIIEALKGHSCQAMCASSRTCSSGSSS